MHSRTGQIARVPECPHSMPVELMPTMVASSCGEDGAEPLLTKPASAAAGAPASRGGGARAPRLHYLDWLRAFLTASVLVHHCFYIFGFGWWPYFGDWLPRNSGSVIVVCWTALEWNQAYFMGLFFVLSGYFAAPGLQRRGPLRYVAGRATRLLLPAAAFELLLAPLTCAISRGANEFDMPPGLASSTSVLRWYWAQYAGVGKNPTWFLFALFLFDLVYAGCSAVSGLPLDGGGGPGPGGASEAPPSPFTVRQVLLGVGSAAAGLSALAFLIRLVFPAGYFLPAVFQGFQPGFFGQYATAFALGTLAYRSQALLRLPQGRAWALGLLAVALAWFCMGWLAVLSLVGGNLEKGMPDPAAPLMGGLGLQALYFACFEQAFAVTWSLGLLLLFRDYANVAPSKPLGSKVTGAAYCTFLVHPVVVFSLTRLLTWAWRVTPQNTVAHILVEIPLVLAASWAVAIAIRAVPYADRLL